MPDLVIFVALVGLIGGAGIVLGMLAARRLGAWDDRHAAADADSIASARGSVQARDDERLEDGGDTGD